MTSDFRRFFGGVNGSELPIPVSTDLYQRLLKRAEETGKTIRTVAAIAIDSYLRAEPPPEKKPRRKAQEKVATPIEATPRAAVDESEWPMPAEVPTEISAEEIAAFVIDLDPHL